MAEGVNQVAIAQREDDGGYGDRWKDAQIFVGKIR